MKYLVWSKIADATITDTHKTLSAARRGPREVLAVRYHFVEADGTPRDEHLTRSLEWSVPQDGRLRIQYQPGKKGKARLEGEQSYIFVAVFLGMCGVMTFATIKVMRQAYDY